MSKLLRRILKISVTPAILMIAGKLFGIIIANVVYHLDFFIDNQIRGIFSIQLYYTNPSTTLLVNSYSNLFMVICLAIPTLYFIIKTSVYQSSLQNPKTIVKITNFNILKWITKDDTSFLKIFIWGSFLVVACLIVVAQTIQGMTYQWIGILAGVLAVFSIWGTIKTYESEIDKIYPREDKLY
ncbi:MAG: hypothetical protein ACOX06_01870 [Candidatus Dojkabacteria bacterium]|jgi:hypothetical protein